MFGNMVIVGAGKRKNKPRIQLSNGKLIKPIEVQKHIATYLLAMAINQLGTYIEVTASTVPGM